MGIFHLIQSISTFNLTVDFTPYCSILFLSISIVAHQEKLKQLELKFRSLTHVNVFHSSLDIVTKLATRLCSSAEINKLKQIQLHYLVLYVYDKQQN